MKIDIDATQGSGAAKTHVLVDGEKVTDLVGFQVWQTLDDARPTVLLIGRPKSFKFLGEAQVHVELNEPWYKRLWRWFQEQVEA